MGTGEEEGLVGDICRLRIPAAALPAVAHRSRAEAGQLVRRLPPAERQRLRASASPASCLHLHALASWWMWCNTGIASVSPSLFQDLQPNTAHRGVLVCTGGGLS